MYSENYSRPRNTDKSQDVVLSVKFFPNMKKFFLAVLFLAAVFSVVYYYNNGGSLFGMNLDQNQTQDDSNRFKIAEPLASQEINEIINIPLNAGKVSLGNLEYKIEKVEKRTEILNQGKKLKPSEGKVFITFQIKINNPTDKNLTVTSRDFIRLSTNGSTELMAPTLHNDPVDISAISVKPVRVGFTIDADSKDVKAQIGQLIGDKKTIDITLF